MSCPNCEELNRRLAETTIKLEALRRDRDMPPSAAKSIRRNLIARARTAQAHIAAAFESLDRVSHSK
jgi:hypothetical protein